MKACGFYRFSIATTIYFHFYIFLISESFEISIAILIQRITNNNPVTATMINRESWSYLCMKWEVPDVIIILKELVSCYVIEDVNCHFIRVNIIFTCLFVIILQTISMIMKYLYFYCPFNRCNSNDQTINQYPLTHMQSID